MSDEYTYHKAEPCQQCRQRHERPHPRAPSVMLKTCTAHRSSDSGTPCKRLPAKGQRVCEVHGGATAAARSAAQKRIAKDKALGQVGALLKECDVENQDPVEGLLEVIRHTGGMMRALSIAVGDQTVTDLAGGSPVAEEYGRWADRYGRACKLAVDAGIEERRVKLVEEQARTVASVMYDVIGALDIPAEQRQRLPELLGRALREIGRADPLDLSDEEFDF